MCFSTAFASSKRSLRVRSELRTSGLGRGSLGFRSRSCDPISRFKLTSPDYLRLGRRIAALKRPTLFVFEGGYAVDAVGVNAVNVVQGFED